MKTTSLLLLLLTTVITCASFRPCYAGMEGELLPETRFLVRPPWKELYFQGGKGFTRIAASVRLRSSRGFCPCDLTGALKDFMPCPFEKANIKVLSVETAVSTLIPPQEEYIHHVWFNKKDGKVYQRIRWKKGAHAWIKAYKWEEKGVRRLKLQPRGPKEINLVPGKWTRKRSSFFPFSQGVKSCSVISEPALLLYLLSIIDTRQVHFPIELCVFGKKQLHRVTIRLMRLKPLKISFESYGLQGEHRVEKTIRPMVFFITTLPEEKKKHEPFSLLGLREDIYIFIDPETRLPVRIMGKTKRAGDMVLALTGAWSR